MTMFEMILLLLFLVSLFANAALGYMVFLDRKDVEIMEAFPREESRYKVARWHIDADRLEARLRGEVDSDLTIDVDKTGESVTVLVRSKNDLSDAAKRKVVAEMPKPEAVG